MKKALHKITLILALLFSATTLTSCGEDFWDDVSDSIWIEDNLLGSWQIVDIFAEYYEDCPYYCGDVMDFYSDGIMQSRSGNRVFEEGYWDVRGREIQIDFNGDYKTDLYAYVRDMDYNYMLLDVRDYAGKYPFVEWLTAQDLEYLAVFLQFFCLSLVSYNIVMCRFSQF
ncbi:MAG: hypothetical protein II199_06270, partial [Bacteroidaceae bacterium]|nr:hypothetical protein [Bacteroidaceae bacterium]